MNQLLSIVDDGLVIKKLSVEILDGPIDVNDDLRVKGNLNVNNNLSINGTATIDTLRVKNLITGNESRPEKQLEYTFVASTEELLVGKGLTFADSAGAKQFVYREGNKLWSSMNIDLERETCYQINGIPVLNQNSLGSSIVNSNLRKIGKLKELTVDGPVVFDDWVFFNNNFNRVGINTEAPNGTVGVLLENSAEFIIDGRENSTKIGNITSNDLDIITDNRTRITIKQTGDIIIGSDKFKNAYVKINGKLIVDELITGAENAPMLPIVFKSSETKTIADTGFLWQHENRNRQFTYALSPDRIVSSEVIDLYKSRYFSIDGSMVLSNSTLGVGVTESFLEKLGTLRELNVKGPTKLATLTVDSLEVNSITNSEKLDLIVDNISELTISHNGSITIGHPDNQSRNIELNGQIKVRGALNLNSHKVTYGETIPVSDQWNRGDIIFNEKPQVNGYVGWVCLESGTPGRWTAFGGIIPDRP